MGLAADRWRHARSPGLSLQPKNDGFPSSESLFPGIYFQVKHVKHFRRIHHKFFYKRGMFNWSVFSNLDKAKTLFQSTFPVMNDPPFLANKNKKTDFLEISSEKKIGFSSTPTKPLTKRL